MNRLAQVLQKLSLFCKVYQLDLVTFPLFGGEYLIKSTARIELKA